MELPAITLLKRAIPLAIIVILIILLVSINSARTSANDRDRQKAIELNNSAVDMFIQHHDTLQAIVLYRKAMHLDPKNLVSWHGLVLMLSSQKRYQEAIDILDEIETENESTPIYHQIKGAVFAQNSEFKKAQSQFTKALSMMDFNPDVVSNQQDLNRLYNYTELEAWTGRKEVALNRLNHVFSMDWLTTEDVEILEFSRNNIEYFQGIDREFKSITEHLLIKTNNADSLVKVLKDQHVNVGQIRSRRDSSEVSVPLKFRQGVEALGLKYEVVN